MGCLLVAWGRGRVGSLCLGFLGLCEQVGFAGLWQTTLEWEETSRRFWRAAARFPFLQGKGQRSPLEGMTGGDAAPSVEGAHPRAPARPSARSRSPVEPWRTAENLGPPGTSKVCLKCKCRRPARLPTRGRGRGTTSNHTPLTPLRIWGCALLRGLRGSRSLRPTKGGPLRSGMVGRSRGGGPRSRCVQMKRGRGTEGRRTAPQCPQTAKSRAPSLSSA